MNARLILASQQAPAVPEDFQGSLIEAMVARLLSETPAPCVLTAPTGSGKTLMISRVISEVSARRPMLWLWFVPYVNLVQQTENGLCSDAPSLSPVRLDEGLNQDPQRSVVIITTSAALSRGASRRVGYTDGEDDRRRSFAAFCELARAKGIEIGVVIDEAHIGVESETEFGRLVRWIRPQRIVMATATPKDKKLNAFIAAAGYDAFQPYSVSRSDVVKARLNKRYIETVIYDLRASLQGLVDLQTLVLKQGWKRNLRLAGLLREHGVGVTPLLLVQVANGDDTIKSAREILTSVCGVPASVIGEHSSDAPDPVLMAQIANDTSKQVLIFKQSAGTGFDAPRAFVLASTKPVNDPDFAMQFMGRVMRVHREIRQRFPKHEAIPAELDTAYVYLANADAQQGFAEAVRATANVQTDLQGMTERIFVRSTVGGAVHLSNRPVEVDPLFYEVPEGVPDVLGGQADALPPSTGDDSNPGSEVSTSDAPASNDGSGQKPVQPISHVRYGETPSLVDLDLPLWDGSANPTPSVAPPRKKLVKPKTIEELLQRLSDAGVNAHALRSAEFGLHQAFASEERPQIENMLDASKQAAARLEIPPEVASMAVRLLLGKVSETEVHTELTTGQIERRKVAITLDRNALAASAKAKMRELPQVEDADAKAMVEVISMRMMDPLVQEFDGIDEDERPPLKELKRIARDAAHWVIVRSMDELTEALHEAIASAARLVDADPLPDFMLSLQTPSLNASAKNIYGVMPPRKGELEAMEQGADRQALDLMRPHLYDIAGRSWRLAEFDGGHVLGEEEWEFAKALDRAEFVRWWHRNPDRKPYAVRLVRGEHRNYFYPDFVVCLEHYPGDSPLMRLVETKESTKDASRKSRRFADYYGKVLFLTKDRSKLRWVKDDGSMGGAVELDDLSAMREWLRSTRPLQN